MDLSHRSASDSSGHTVYERWRPWWSCLWRPSSLTLTCFEMFRRYTVCIDRTHVWFELGICYTVCRRQCHVGDSSGSGVILYVTVAIMSAHVGIDTYSIRSSQRTRLCGLSHHQPTLRSKYTYSIRSSQRIRLCGLSHQTLRRSWQRSYCMPPSHDSSWFSSMSLSVPTFQQVIRTYCMSSTVPRG